MSQLSNSVLMPVAMSTGQIRSAQTAMDQSGADVFSQLMAVYQSYAVPEIKDVANKAAASLQQSPQMSLPVLTQATVADSSLAVAQTASAAHIETLSDPGQVESIAKETLTPVQTQRDVTSQGANPIQPALSGLVQTDQISQIRSFSGELVNGVDADTLSQSHIKTLSDPGNGNTVMVDLTDVSTSDKSKDIQENHTDPLQTESLQTESLQTQVQSIAKEMLTPADVPDVRDVASSRLQRRSNEGDSEGDVTAAPGIRESLPFTEQQRQQLAVASAPSVPSVSSLVQAEPMTSAIKTRIASQIPMTSVTTTEKEVNLAATATIPSMNETSLGDEGAIEFASQLTASAAPVSGTISSLSTSPERPMPNLVGLASGGMSHAVSSSEQMNHSRGEDQNRDRRERSLDNFSGLSSLVPGDDAQQPLSPAASTAPRFENLMANVNMRQPHWAQEIGQKVGIMVNSNLNEVEIGLDPAELGSVQIRLRLDEDKKVHVMMTAANGLTRDMLENALPRLREMLSQQGIELGSADVNTGGHPQHERGRSGNDMIERVSESEQNAVNSVQESLGYRAETALVDQFA